MKIHVFYQSSCKNNTEIKKSLLLYHNCKDLILIIYLYRFQPSPNPAWAAYIKKQEIK